MTPKDMGWETGNDPNRKCYGCCLSALTGLALDSPAPTSRIAYTKKAGGEESKIFVIPQNALLCEI